MAELVVTLDGFDVSHIDVQKFDSNIAAIQSYITMFAKLQFQFLCNSSSGHFTELVKQHFASGIFFINKKQYNFSMRVNEE